MSLFLDWSSFHSIKQVFWSQVKGTPVRVKGIFVIEKAIVRFAVGFGPAILMPIFLTSQIQAIVDRSVVTQKINLNV